jgi:hypothetical protein
MKKFSWQYLVDTLLFVSVVGVIIIGFLLAFVIPKGPSATDQAKYFLGLHRHDWGDLHLYLGIAFTVLSIVHLLLGWKWIKGRTLGLFGNKWKVVLTAICVLPILVLAVVWTIFPSEPNIYAHSEPGSAQLDRGILEANTIPPYNPSNIPPMTSGKADSIGAQSAVRRADFEPRIENQKEHRRGEHSSKEAGFSRGRGSEDISGILITGQTTLWEIEKDTGIPPAVLAERLGIPEGISSDESLGRLRKRYGFSMQQVRALIPELLERRQGPKASTRPQEVSQRMK